MKQCSIAVVLLLALAAAGQAGSGWTALFNGKDLSGWKKNGDEKWVVDRGHDSLRKHSEQVWLLNHRKDVYGNFDLRLKFKGEAEGNSGVSSTLESRASTRHGPDIEGMQVEVDPGKGKHTGGLYESGGRGWVAMPTAEGENALKPGGWNDLEVSVQGAHILTHLNGVKVVDYTDPCSKIHRGRNRFADSHRRRCEDALERN